jgi:PncC family amidohydrolase
MSNNPYNQAKTTGELTKQVASALIDRRLRLTTAESCTGGSLAAALCAEADTAAFYDIGLITFSDRAKQQLLDVNASTLEKYSAVSRQTVEEMSPARWRVPGRISVSPLADTRGRTAAMTGRLRGPSGSRGIFAAYRRA